MPGLASIGWIGTQSPDFKGLPGYYGLLYGHLLSLCLGGTRWFAVESCVSCCNGSGKSYEARSIETYGIYLVGFVAGFILLETMLMWLDTFHH